MKKLALVILAVFSLSLMNCKTKSKATTSSDKPNKTVADDGTKLKCRLVVSFWSVASGIDGPKYDEIEAFIKNHPKKPSYEVIPMGREGERDICMSLKEMNKDEIKTFIDDLNKMAKTSDRVKVMENQERVKRP
jgi:hypothetical protein